MFLLLSLLLLLEQSVAPAPDTYDYIIVGSGAAGSVLADRLSADPRGFRVLVIEAGPDDDAFPTKPIFQEDKYRVIANDADIDWGYSGFSAARPLNPFPIQTAKIAGGCTSHNAAMWVQATPTDWNNWATIAGDTMWNWDNIQDAWKSLENFPDGGANNRGHSGAMPVQRSPGLQPFANKIIQVAGALGIPTPTDYNTQPREGINVVQMNSANNVRNSAYRAYLRPNLIRSNLKIIFNSQVSKVLFSGSRTLGWAATGVSYTKDGVSTNVYITPNTAGEVILSAGTIGTPQILQLSGIGPNCLLLGILNRVENDNVGKNLQDHIMFPVVYTSPVVAFSPTIEWTQIMGFQSLDGANDPELQYFFWAREGGLDPPLLNLPASLLNPSKQAFCSPVLLHPKSRGTVRILSSDVTQAPFINANFLTEDQDKAILKSGADYCRQLFNHSIFQTQFPNTTELIPGTSIISDLIMSTAAQTVWHPVGTSKMGKASDTQRVVDSNLRVVGVTKLRVVDASVIPVLPSGNTQVPTMTIAAKIAAKILSDRV